MKDFLRKILPESFILWTHKVRAIAANIWYGFPSRHLKVIGVTGTNGKTTTCHLISGILEEAGYKVGMLTTIDFKIGEEIVQNTTKMTTLNPFILQNNLFKMAKVGCHYAIIETTSHAISQYRNWGIRYHAAVLTNITHDHLDYHKNFQEYRNTKLKLFSKNPQVSVINLDDESAKIFLAQGAKKTYAYAIENKANIVAKKILYEKGGSLFTLVGDFGQITINLALPGKFNIYNAMASFCVGLGENIDTQTIKKALELTCGVPGRMEKIDCGQNFAVIIDFAHTPDGLMNVFETVKYGSRGRIIHVGGATGERDRTKRPILGALSGKYADITIVTNEDPYSEDPQKIIEEVAKGVPRGAGKDNPKTLGKNFFLEPNRKTAILKALSMTKKDDIVLITGKGCETKMAISHNQFIPWSDREIVEEELNK